MTTAWRRGGNIAAHAKVHRRRGGAAFEQTVLFTAAAGHKYTGKWRAPLGDERSSYELSCQRGLPSALTTGYTMNIHGCVFVMDHLTVYAGAPRARPDFPQWWEQAQGEIADGDASGGDAGANAGDGARPSVPPPQPTEAEAGPQPAPQPTEA